MYIHEKSHRWIIIILIRRTDGHIFKILPMDHHFFIRPINGHVFKILLMDYLFAFVLPMTHSQHPTHGLSFFIRPTDGQQFKILPMDYLSSFILPMDIYSKSYRWIIFFHSSYRWTYIQNPTN